MEPSHHGENSKDTHIRPADYDGPISINNTIFAEYQIALKKQAAFNVVVIPCKN